MSTEQQVRRTAQEALTAVLMGAAPADVRAEVERAMQAGARLRGEAIEVGRRMGEIDTGPEPDDTTAGHQKGGPGC